MPMKKQVIFFGSNAISLPLLEYLQASQLMEITGVITQPDRPSGRGQALKSTVISDFSEKYNIPLLKPHVLDVNTVAWIKSMGCDIIFIMAYGRILKKNILELPSLGIYNFHASVLPKYRGASPIESAITCGDSETGVSLMQVVEAMDAGAIADMEKVPIEPNDTYMEVTTKISLACLPLLERNSQAICDDTVSWQEQDPLQATYTRKLSSEDGILDFSRPALYLKNLVNAFTPHIGCRIDHYGIFLKIKSPDVEPMDCSRFKIGEVISAGVDGVKIVAKDGLLVIHELQRPGGKMLRAVDFLNGFAMRPGDVITSHASQELVHVRPYVKN
jgi:methionyl-tRNA formyltransferase